MIREIKSLLTLGELQRPKLDIAPVSEIAAVYEPKSWLATKSWKAEEPWENYGIVISDFIGHWMVNSQARTINRIGAPADFVYRFDPRPGTVPVSSSFLWSIPSPSLAMKCSGFAHCSGNRCNGGLVLRARLHR